MLILLMLLDTEVLFADKSGGWWYNRTQDCSDSILTGDLGANKSKTGCYWATSDNWHADYTNSLTKIVMRMMPDQQFQQSKLSYSIVLTM